MERTDKDVYNYRKDHRTDSEFECHIRKMEEIELFYFRNFVVAHNKRRHKREITFEHWCNKVSNEIVKDIDMVK